MCCRDIGTDYGEVSLRIEETHNARSGGIGDSGRSEFLLQSPGPKCGGGSGDGVGWSPTSN